MHHLPGATPREAKYVRYSSDERIAWSDGTGGSWGTMGPVPGQCGGGAVV